MGIDGVLFPLCKMTTLKPVFSGVNKQILFLSVKVQTVQSWPHHTSQLVFNSAFMFNTRIYSILFYVLECQFSIKLLNSPYFWYCECMQLNFCYVLYWLVVTVTSICTLYKVCVSWGKSYMHRHSSIPSESRILILKFCTMHSMLFGNKRIFGNIIIGYFCM